MSVRKETVRGFNPPSMLPFQDIRQHLSTGTVNPDSGVQATGMSFGLAALSNTFGFGDWRANGTTGAGGSAQESPAPESLQSQLYNVRVHNDDVHTYDEVIAVLTDVAMLKDSPNPAAVARAQTVDVDKRGEAVVLNGVDCSTAATALQKLHSAGLLTCIIKKGHVDRELRGDTAIGWLTWLSETGAASRATVAAALVSTAEAANQLPPGHGASKGAVPETRVLKDGSTVVDLHASKRQGAGPGKLFPTSDVFRSEEFAAPSTILQLLLLGDPFSLLSTKTALRGLYLRLIPDAGFKFSIAAALAKALPRLQFLFARGIGCAALSVFDVAVQLWTTPSLVHRLDVPTAGEQLPLVETMLLCLAGGLLQNGSLQMWSENFGGNTSQTLSSEVGPGSHWSHSRYFLHSRYTNLLNDLRWALRIPETALRLFYGGGAVPEEEVALGLLSGSGKLDQVGNAPGRRGDEARATLLDIMCLIQGADPLRRTPAGNPHDAVESRRWGAAWSLALPIMSLVESSVAQAVDEANASSGSNCLKNGPASFLLALCYRIIGWVKEHQSEDDVAGSPTRASEVLWPRPDSLREPESRRFKVFDVVAASLPAAEQDGDNVYVGKAEVVSVKFGVGRDMFSLHIPLQRIAGFLARKMATSRLPFPHDAQFLLQNDESSAVRKPCNSIGSSFSLLSVCAYTGAPHPRPRTPRAPSSLPCFQCSC